MLEGEELAKRMERTRQLGFLNNELLDCENKIMSGFSQMVSAFKYIEKKQLWKWTTKEGEYTSMDDYCMKKWNIGVRRRQQLMHADSVKTALSDEVSTPEAKAFVEAMREGHVRALDVVPEEKRAEVVETVVKSKAKVTAPKIKEIAAKMGVIPASELPQPKPKKPDVVIDVCPHCGGTL